MSLSFIHDIMGYRFLFITEYYSTVWLYLCVFTHSSVDEPLGYLYLGVTRIKAHGYCCTNISVSLRYIPSRIIYSVIYIYKKMVDFSKDEHFICSQRWHETSSCSAVLPVCVCFSFNCNDSYMLQSPLFSEWCL